MPQDTSTITASFQQRVVYWKNHNDRASQLKRFPIAATRHLCHRASRYLGHRLGILQLLYLLALLFGSSIVFLESLGYFITDGFGNISQYRWPTFALSACAVIIFAYKNRVSHSRILLPNNEHSRAGIAQVLQNIQPCVDESKSNRLNRDVLTRNVVDCISRDVQQFLSIPEDDVAVSVLKVKQYQNNSNHPHDYLEKVAHDKPRPKGYFSSPRYALQSYVYECIRLRRSVVFHDVRDPNFRALFPDENRPYRSVYAMPISLPGSIEPEVIVAVNLKDSYTLWPLLQNKIDKLLVLYEPLLHVLIKSAKIDPNASNSQMELF